MVASTAVGAPSSALIEGLAARLQVVQAGVELACGNSRRGMARAELANDVLSQTARLTDEVSKARKATQDTAAGVLQKVRNDYLTWLRGEVLRERDHYLQESNTPGVPFAQLQSDYLQLVSDVRF